VTTQVLMLHRVMPDAPVAFGRPSCYRLRGTALTPAELERLLEAGPFLSLREVTEALRCGEPPPPGRVLTFDDGYREWAEVVAPRLDARGVQAAFLASPAFVRGLAPRAHPVDELYWLLDHARRPRFELRLPDGVVERGTLETDAGKAALVMGALKRWVVCGARHEVREVLLLLAEALEVEVTGDLPHTLYPSEPELQALAAAGHWLGGHGMSHRHLSTMEVDEAVDEVSASLAWVTRLAGKAPAPFAYPDGAFDTETERHVEQAGAACALTCVPGPVTRESRLFQLPREFITPGHSLVASLAQAR